MTLVYATQQRAAAIPGRARRSTGPAQTQPLPGTGGHFFRIAERPL